MNERRFTEQQLDEIRAKALAGYPEAKVVKVPIVDADGFRYLICTRPETDAEVTRATREDE